MAFTLVLWAPGSKVEDVIRDCWDDGSRAFAGFPVLAGDSGYSGFTDSVYSLT